jgi:hypothetical protein
VSKIVSTGGDDKNGKALMAGDDGDNVERGCDVICRAVDSRE